MRLSADEAALIEDMRNQRLKDAQSRGGRIRGDQVREAHLSAGEDQKKREALKKLDQGETPVAVASDLEISVQTVYNWIKEAGRSKGGRVVAEKRAVAESRIKGMGAIREELGKRGVILGIDDCEIDANSEMVDGDLRPDNVIEVTSNSIGVISDCHVPFHDLRRDSSGKIYGSYLTALEYLKDRNIGTLIINGDFMDNYNLSAHEKIESKRDWSWEADAGRAMLRALRAFFGDKVRIIYREGNHEERLQRYLAAKANQVQNMLILSEILHLSSLGIEWVGERSKLTVGSLWVDHGHEWFGSGGVNPARAYRMKAQDNILVGHVHKTSFDMHKRPLDGSFSAGWSMGCLCDLNPHYAARNHWNHGVVHITLDGSGEFTLDNRIILHGKVR